MRLRACLAKVLRAAGGIAGPSRSIAPSGPLSVGAGLVSGGLQLSNAVLQQGVSEIGNAVLDGVVEPLEPGVRFGRSLAQCGDMRGSALSAFFSAVEHRG